MNEAKQAQLAQQGWKATSVEEFLELTPEEMAYIEVKLALSRNLKLRRIEQNLSQQRLAERLESSQSRVAKMEKGDSSVSIDLLVRSLLALDVTPEEIGQFIVAAG